MLAGHPARIQPLTPYRTKHKVTFQLKRGPKRQKRGKNSLFLKSQLDAIRTREKQLQKLRKQASSESKKSHAPDTPPSTGSGIHPCYALNVDGLMQEEVQMYTEDLSRWDDDRYTLRIEEMEIFVKLLNSICTLHDQHTWIGISGENKYETEVASALTSTENPKVCFTLAIILISNSETGWIFRF